MTTAAARTGAPRPVVRLQVIYTRLDAISSGCGLPGLAVEPTGPRSAISTGLSAPGEHGANPKALLQRQETLCGHTGVFKEEREKLPSRYSENATTVGRAAGRKMPDEH